MSWTVITPTTNAFTSAPFSTNSGNQATINISGSLTDDETIQLLGLDLIEQTYTVLWATLTATDPLPPTITIFDEQQTFVLKKSITASPVGATLQLLFPVN